MTRARVLTFHVDSDELPGLTEALDCVAEQFAQQPDFRELLCLEHDGRRNEIVVITLWDGPGLEDTQAVSDAGRQRIAATTDLGVMTKCYDVLRLVPGAGWLERAVEVASA